MRVREIDHARYYLRATSTDLGEHIVALNNLWRSFFVKFTSDHPSGLCVTNEVIIAF